jgi:hypothetical protein
MLDKSMMDRLYLTYLIEDNYMLDIHDYQAFEQRQNNQMDNLSELDNQQEQQLLMLLLP